MRASSLRAWHIWRWPVVLNVITVMGLIAPLVGDGWWDAVSWGALGLLVAVSLWCGKFGRHPSPRRCSGPAGAVETRQSGKASGA